MPTCLDDGMAALLVCVCLQVCECIYPSVCQVDAGLQYGQACALNGVRYDTLFTVRTEFL